MPTTTSENQYTVATDPTFQHRIEMLMLKAAANVQAESPDAEHHDRRSALARQIFHDPAGFAQRFAAAVAADPNGAGINLASTDNDLLFTINALFNAFALP
jgi:hypothetical protein